MVDISWGRAVMLLVRLRARHPEETLVLLPNHLVSLVVSAGCWLLILAVNRLIIVQVHLVGLAHVDVVSVSGI